MNLQCMTQPELIFTGQHFTNKTDILNHLAEALWGQGYLNDKQLYLDSVLQREEHSATGIERGLAIPHGKSEAVKKAGFAVMTLDTPLSGDSWASLSPDNQVELIILLAVPETEAGDLHLKLLGEFSKRLMNKDFTDQLKRAGSPEKVYSLLDQDVTAERSAATTSDAKTFVLAITSCATGIAHTYMAAEALNKAAGEMGIGIHVEKQGANGIEDRITPEMIQKADGILFAVDTKVKEKERFAGKPYVEVKVAEPLKNSKQLIQTLLDRPQGIVEGENTSDDFAKNSGAGKHKTVKEELTTAVMTGISYMIPMLVAGGLMLGIAKLVWVYALGMDPGQIGDELYKTSGGITQFIHYLDGFGSLLFKFVYPVFAMFAAYSISDRLGLVSGFAGGLFSAGLHYTFWGINGGIPSGFLGALVLGIAAGYISRFLNEKIKLPKNFAAMKPMFLVPGISVFAIFLLNMYLIDPVFGQLNLMMANGIKSMSGTGQLTLSAVIAAATAFDLGGPVNKAAGAIAIGLASDQVFPLTPRVLAIVIPPIGLGLATMLDRFVVKRRVFPADLRVVGGTSFLLGFLAISEGALPFMLRNPLITIPINMIGAIAGSCIAVALGAVQWLPLPAIWGWPLVENFAAYFIGLAVGALFIALANIFIRYWLIRKEEKKQGL